LRSSTVDLFWLTDHDCAIFKIVEDNQLSYLEIFETTFNDTFFEVAKKP